MKKRSHTSRYAMLAAVILWVVSCKSTNGSDLASSAIVPAPGQTVGSGYDSIAGQIRQACVQVTPLEDAADIGQNPGIVATSATSGSERQQGHKLTSIADYVTSMEDLARRLGIDPIEFVWSSRTPSSLSNLVEAQNINQYSTNYLIWLKVVHKAQVMRNVKLQPEFEGMLLDNADRFFQLCGDNFVGGLSNGDFFYAVITIKSESLEKQKQNLTKINKYLEAAKLKDANPHLDGKPSENLMGPVPAAVVYYQFGKKELVKTQFIEFALDEKRRFLSIAEASKGAVAMYLRSYEFTTMAPYDEPLRNVRGILRQMGQARLSNLSLKNQIDYVLNNPSSFTGINQAQLRADRNRFAANADKIMELAKLCLADAKKCQFDENLQADRGYKLPDLNPV